ncbi:hypothetical protein D3869_25000 (plasmid) [Azospirillum brasilense]|uniref:Uncharacterized protein n=1 Tax=Azospirillum brasilense TaxID=192 RepID=A0A4D8RNM4_AZOBR|nr:hypothetical protein D3869_25000 [Azospirillum brasilense]
MTRVYGLQRGAKHHVPPAAAAWAVSNPANCDVSVFLDSFAALLWRISIRCGPRRRSRPHMRAKPAGE